jgi:thermitase
MTKLLSTTLTIGLVLGFSTTTLAEDLLVKLASPISTEKTVQQMNFSGLNAHQVMPQWISIKGDLKSSKLNLQLRGALENGTVLYVQPNYKLNVFKNPSLVKAAQNAALVKYIKGLSQNQVSTLAKPTDNPNIPNAPTTAKGADPLFSKQWGMIDNGLENALKINVGQKIIVAVIDTGVDYTHEDLLPNMWRNSNEIPDNGIDDDQNGYVDDIVGWDFLKNDNKPYDLASTDLGDLLGGANPGHGTHCAGNVAARGNNSKGISGVNPNAQIMALRFIGDEGGTTTGAIGAIRYAVDNGAKILSNSWGSEGEDPADAVENKALQEAIQYAMDKNVLFIAASANSGRNNDTDAKKAFPASYTFDNIISVAAIDSANKLASFSNYGATSVDIGAPGVKIFSTTVSNKYSDTVIELMGANWDGTSMACPHVAGAAALYWSANPEKTWQEVKSAILKSAKPISSLTGKTVTGAKLSVEDLMKFN